MNQRITQRMTQRITQRMPRRITGDKLSMNVDSAVDMNSCNAFFSVEAAVIMPLVIAAVLLAVSLFVFQYDRCLLEQDISAQALRAASAMAKTAEELTEKIQIQTAGLYRNKYVAWDMIALEVKMKKGIINAVGEGEFRFLLPGWNFWNKDTIWNARADYKAHRINATAFIRNCRRLKTGTAVSDTGCKR